MHSKLSPVGGHQPAQPTVGGVSAAHNQPCYVTIEMHLPVLHAAQAVPAAMRCALSHLAILQVAGCLLFLLHLQAIQILKALWN